MSDVPLIMMYWQDKHKEIFGTPYLPTYGKDNKLLKDMLGVYDADVMKRFIDIFFGMVMSDKFLQTSGASIGVFRSQLPKIVMQDMNRKEEEKEENIGRL